MKPPTIINVTQADIDAADPMDASNNCVAIALKRALPDAKVIKAWAYIQKFRIDERKFDMDDWPVNRLILHENGRRIEPFEFEIEI